MRKILKQVRIGLLLIGLILGTCANFVFADVNTGSPYVVNTSPANGATNVSLYATIYVDYSEKIYVSDNIMRIIIVDKDGDYIGQGATYPEISSTGKRIELTLGQGVKASTQYTVKIYDTFKDVDGNRSVPYTFSFTTAPIKATTSEDQRIHFNDVPSNHWAFNEINGMTKNGVINGYSNGAFMPSNKVTREEFAKMFVLALNPSLEDTLLLNFADLSSSRWSYMYVETAKDYLTGFEDNGTLYFKPTDYAEREDVAYALVKAKGYENEAVEINELSTIFTDADQISSGMTKYVLIAYKKGLIAGNSGPGNTRFFNPHGALTRAEAAKMLFNTSGMEKVLL